MQPQGNWLTAALPFVVIAIVLAIRFRRMRRELPLNPERLWIAPAIYVLLAGTTLYSLMPPQMGWLLMIAGVAVGAVLGWHRGKLIHMTRNPENGDLTQRASPLAVVLLAALVALKLGAKAIFGDSAVGHPSSSAMLLTDAFIGFALGLLTATRLELYLRARRLLGQSV
jgi:NAD/NADP transhydrogenase beta subunit